MTADSTKPIYERANRESSDARWRISTGALLLGGAVSGGAVWLIFAIIGVPKIVGIDSESGLIPLIVIGALVARGRFRFVMPAVAFLSLMVVALVSYTPIMSAGVRPFVRSDPLPRSADAIVVLSAGVTGDGYLSQEGLDRTLKGVELAASGVAPLVVFTLEEKGSGAKVYNATGDQRRIAKLAGVSNVIFTGSVKSTHGEALEVLKMATARGWSRVVLVTSPFHTKRACATFEKLGIKVSCTPSDSRGIAVKRLVYARDRLGAFAMLLYETAGTIWYGQRGWI